MPRFVMTKQKFINQWLRQFAPGLSKDSFDKYVKGQYIWHIFTHNLTDVNGLLVGDAARKAFDEADKNACVCCDMFGSGGVTDILSEQLNCAEKIDRQMMEFYVVARDYSWTYIKTHENEFYGPYFLRK